MPTLTEAVTAYEAQLTEVVGTFVAANAAASGSATAAAGSATTANTQAGIATTKAGEALASKDAAGQSAFDANAIAIDLQTNWGDKLATATSKAAESTASAAASEASRLASGVLAVLAATAKTQAEAARDASQLSSGTWPTTTSALGNGVAGYASLVAGSGGANGTFALAFSGGTQVLAPAGYFVVAGGVVVQVVITYPGYYSAGTPTISFSASAGLTGASATAVMAVNVAAGKYFGVPSPESAEYLILYLNNAGVAVEQKRYYSVSALEPDPAAINYELSWRDAADNVAMGITRAGEVEIPKAKVLGGTVNDVTMERANLGGTVAESVGSAIVEWGVTDANNLVALGVTFSGGVMTPGAVSEVTDIPGMAWAVTDGLGNIAIGVKDGGELLLPGFSAAAVPTALDAWKTLNIGTDDSIVHIGDSYTASHYTVKDKAYISQLSALSPYRHQNFGVSGNDALDMQYRIVNQSDYAGLSFKGMTPKYAFITTHTNDTFFRTADLTYYAENIRRLIETVRAEGVEPILTTEFEGPMADLSLLRRIADEYRIAFIDCTGYDAEANGLDLSMFHQGHPGTRTNGVFWLPMLDFIDRMPKPEKAIKVYRRRTGFAVTGIADLLYTGRIERSRKWKELTLAHYSLDPEAKYDELSQLGAFGYFWQNDEYQRIAAGAAVAFTDYTLVEIALPGTALTLDAVELTLGTASTPAVYARDFLDVAAGIPGRAQGSTPSDATYLAKWNKPRGAWRLLGNYAGPLVIPKADLRKSMQGDRLVLMVAGAFSLTGLSVRYQGGATKPDPRQPVSRTVIGAELLTQPLCGTTGQLAAWTQAGTPTTLIPIDLSNAPRKPGTNTPVDGVCTISASNTIGQTVTLPTETGLFRRYRVMAWVRYFPKAWLSTSLYPGLDANQVIDRIANPTLAPITEHTFDLRTLKCEIWSGAASPTEGGAEYFDFAPLWWRPIEFVVDAPAYRSGSAISFRLSCPDGEIQVSKVSFKEVSL